jgi:hypothetical protein
MKQQAMLVRPEATREQTSRDRCPKFWGGFIKKMDGGPSAFVAGKVLNALLGVTLLGVVDAKRRHQHSSPGASFV